MCLDVPLRPLTLAGVGMWLRSAATPGVCTMSKRLSSVTLGSSLRSRDRGCPMPPDAPTTAT